MQHLAQVIDGYSTGNSAANGGVRRWPCRPGWGAGRTSATSMTRSCNRGFRRGAWTYARATRSGTRDGVDARHGVDARISAGDTEGREACREKRVDEREREPEAVSIPSETDHLRSPRALRFPCPMTQPCRSDIAAFSRSPPALERPAELTKPPTCAEQMERENPGKATSSFARAAGKRQRARNVGIEARLAQEFTQRGAPRHHCMTWDNRPPSRGRKPNTGRDREARRGRYMETVAAERARYAVLP